MNRVPGRRGQPAAARPPQLDELCDLADYVFDDPEDMLVPEAVTPEELPATPQKLLVHNDHMTTRLQTHYGKPVALRVHDAEADGPRYEREITLSLFGTNVVVEYGIVRIDLALMAEPVRAEILAQRAPLGDILLRHNVMRRIEPTGYLRFGPRSWLLRYFKDRSVTTAFGRTGVIYCDGQPAIRLLEVVRAAD